MGRAAGCGQGDPAHQWSSHPGLGGARRTPEDPDPHLPQATARIGDALAVETHEPGTEVAPGITSLRIGAISADEGALHIAVGSGAIAFADGLGHSGDELDFVPDS